jgi:ubiquinone/menaquinone biosynthesis C-methylase UbiE
MPAQPHGGYASLLKLYRALVCWTFDRFYQEFAWTYDMVAWLVSRGLWYRWTAAALPYLQGYVLELGCGTGYMQYVLSATSPGKAVGIDASRQMLTLAMRRTRPTGRAVRLLRGKAQRLPFESGSFQSVLSTFPSTYILDPATLNEIHRVLTEDGRLVIVDNAQLTHSDFYAYLVSLAYRLVFPTAETTDPDHSLARDHLYTRVLDQAGFIVEVHTEQIRQSQVMIFVARRQTTTTLPGTNAP